MNSRAYPTASKHDAKSARTFRPKTKKTGEVSTSLVGTRGPRVQALKTADDRAGRPYQGVQSLLFPRIAGLGRCALAALVACGTFHYEAQAADAEAVRTAPVGLATLRVPAKSARALSVPLANPAVFTGTISSFEDNSLVVGGANWTADQYGPFSVNPHVVRLLSGPVDGQIFAIESHSADVLVLEEAAAGLLESGQLFEIVPVDTLAGLFGEDAAGLLTDTDPSKADNVMIHDGTDWSTYFNDGTRWFKEGAGDAPQNSVALLPDEGIFIVRKASTPLSIVVSGEVATTRMASDLPAGSITFFANPFPLNTRLSKLQLQEDPSWRSGSDPESADLVHLYMGNKWRAFFFDGKKWRQEGGAVRDPHVTKGSAIVIERAAGEDIVHAPEPPYSLN